VPAAFALILQQPLLMAAAKERAGFLRKAAGEAQST